MQDSSDNPAAAELLLSLAMFRWRLGQMDQLAIMLEERPELTSVIAPVILASLNERFARGSLKPHDVSAAEAAIARQRRMGYQSGPVPQPAPESRGHPRLQGAFGPLHGGLLSGGHVSCAECRDVAGSLPLS